MIRFELLVHFFQYTILGLLQMAGIRSLSFRPFLDLVSFFASMGSGKAIEKCAFSYFWIKATINSAFCTVRNSFEYFRKFVQGLVSTYSFFDEIVFSYFTIKTFHFLYFACVNYNSFGGIALINLRKPIGKWFSSEISFSKHP